MLNQGISFGLWQGISVWVLLLLWIGLFVYALKMRELWGRVGAGLLLLGGAGNIISRVVYGGVVDNLNFFGLFYNNVWDYLIFIGVIVYVWKNTFSSHD
jgi:signal peptidase II